MTALIRTLIVDDEPLNRVELRYLLAQHADVEIVGEADSIDSARAAIAPAPARSRAARHSHR
jgi:Response regulator of the LytR/AlgR family